eukprot:900966-Lingulodinium_polyedra.AAC.1
MHRAVQDAGTWQRGRSVLTAQRCTGRSQALVNTADRSLLRLVQQAFHILREVTWHGVAVLVRGDLG